ncbi:acyl-CoA N-acyltransferase [Mycena amicta]|nr:acyl-CoA N-acyltransferase [Mycena amicta]
MQPQNDKLSAGDRKSEIVIRQYLPKDYDQVYALLDVGFAVGPGSPGAAAFAKSLWTPAALASYAFFLAGCFLSLNTAPILGLTLCLLAVGTILYLRHGAAQAFRNFCKNARQTDMQDITAYYQISAGQALTPAGFWVAVIQGDIDEVVGFFGMEHLPSRPTVGHLRRMIVSPHHRRRRIGSLIIQAIIAHAQKHSPNGAIGGPLTRLELETSVYQPPARALYEKHGFRVVGSRIMPLARPGLLHSVQVLRLQRAVWEQTDGQEKTSYGACDAV